MLTWISVLLAAPALVQSYQGGDLIVGENSDRPWPGGKGEVPPPLGAVSLLSSATGEKTVLQSGLVDPVWVTTNKTAAFVGLFHGGAIVMVDGAGVAPSQTLAEGLSCPEDLALDRDGGMWVVENPVGNECRGTNLTREGHLTKVDLNTGAFERTVELSFPHGMDIELSEGTLGAAYVCESGRSQLSRVDLGTRVKTKVAPLISPSGCAVGGGKAYVVEQGGSDGSLVEITLSGGYPKRTLLSNLAGPMGVALDVQAGFVYVGVRHLNQIVRVALNDGSSSVFAANLNSPIGLAVVRR